MCTVIDGICFTEIFFPCTDTNDAASTVMILHSEKGMKAIRRTLNSRI